VTAPSGPGGEGGARSVGARSVGARSGGERSVGERSFGEQDADPGRGAGAPPRPQSLRELFLVFSGLALRGFGGVLPWAQRVLVEERRWLTREQFVEMLAFAQLLPGPNICNLSLMAGDRWFGWRGALAAFGGLVALPAVLVLSLAALYGGVADQPVARRALLGMGAVAGGMILGTAVKLAATQRARWRWLAFGAAAFVGVALLRIRLLWVLAAIAPIAIALAWRVERRRMASPAGAGAGGGGAPRDGDAGGAR
jgi:chromate transporter